MKKFATFDGTCCDVGCSTGEFLSTIEWKGQKFGMEINPAASALAEKTGVDFSRSILTEESFFDAVLFRGTIQHLDQPFHYIQQSLKALKPGGVVFFIATPNTNSTVYKLFNDLPALDDRKNYYLPSDRNLTSILRNEGFKVLSTSYPYLSSPYASPFMDHIRFVANIFRPKKPTFAFWRSMMDIAAQKPIEHILGTGTSTPAS